MKRVFTLLISVFVVFACNTDVSKFNRLLTEKIQYDVYVNNYDKDLDWWIQNIEGPKRDKFIHLVFDAIKDNKLKIYDMNEKSTDLENVISNLFTFDTIQLKNNGVKKQLIDTVFISSSFDLNNINQFRFREKWTFNEKTLLVEKQVSAYCPLLTTELENNETKVSLPLFWVISDTAQKSDNNDLVQVTSKIQYDVFIKSENKNNLWYVDNIETTDREYFLNKIFEVASKGKLKIYDFFDKPIDKENFNSILHKSDTVLIDKPDASGAYDTKVVKTDIDAKSITKIRFVEEWKIDKVNFRFYKIVKAISLLQEVKDDVGNIRGYTPIFWIYFDENIKNITN